MSHKLPVGAIKDKREWVEEALRFLSRHEYYGFKHLILGVKTYASHSNEWPVDFEVMMKGRRKTVKQFLYIDFTPSRQPTKHLKEMLARNGITRIVINVFSKFRTIVRELAASLKQFMSGVSRRQQNSLCSRSFHPHMSGARFGCAA